MFWLNIDIPSKTWRLHSKSCPFCTPSETHRKGLEEMKVNGGWFKFSGYKEAYKSYAEKGEDSLWLPCKYCKPSD